MKIRTGICCLAVCAIVLQICAVAGVAQTASEDTLAKANEQKARDTLSAMVKALGGDAWLTLKDETYEGRTSSFYQGAPTGGIGDFFDFRRFPDHERIEFGKKRDVVELLVGNAGWEVTYRGKKALPQEQVDDVIRRREHSIETAIRVWLKDPKTIVIFDKQSLVERHLADQVTLISAANDSITIQMDAQTHLPLRRSFQWRDPLYKDKNDDAEEYDNYRPIGGIQVPTTTTRFHNGDMTSQRFLYRAEFNTNLQDSIFDADATVAKIKK